MPKTITDKPFVLNFPINDISARNRRHTSNERKTKARKNYAQMGKIGNRSTTGHNQTISSELSLKHVHKFTVIHHVDCAGFIFVQLNHMHRVDCLSLFRSRSPRPPRSPISFCNRNGARSSVAGHSQIGNIVFNNVARPCVRKS